MALTKVQTIGIETGISLTGVTTVTTLNASTDTLSVGGTVNFGGNVSIAGTLTYEDVTNIDSVGIITARNGIKVNDLGVQVGTGATVDSAADNTLTFLTNGSERLRVTSDGSIGAGTDNPLTTFHIARGSDDNSILYITGADTSSEFVALGVGANYGMLTAGGSGSTSTDLIFRTANSGTEAERMRIDSSGRLLVGTTSGNYTTEIVSDGEANLAIRTYNNGAQHFAGIRLFKARGSAASPNIVHSGDMLNQFSVYGYDGANFKQAANIAAFVDGTPGTNDMPGRLVFGTTADGGSGPTERMRIDSSGRVGIGTSSPTTPLSVRNFSTISTYGNVSAQFSDNSTGTLYVQHSSGKVQLGSDAALAFGSGTSATERMVITSSGYVGIGASPSYQLDVTGTANNGSVVSRVRNASEQNGALAVHQIAAGSSTLRHVNNLVSYYGQYYQQAAIGVHTYYRDFNTHILRSNSGSAYLRVAAGGRVYIGSTGFTSSNTVRINMSFTGGGTEYGMSMNAGSLVAGTKYITFDIGTTQYGSIGWTGTQIGFYNTSDYRLKENIVDLEGGIERVKQLQPRRFNFTHNRNTTVDGFIAHEAQAAMPEAVYGTHNEVDSDGNPVYQSIDQSKFVPLLTAALQEAIAKIETLETQNASLEARLTALEGAS